MEFTIFSSTGRENPGNCFYNSKIIVTDEILLAQAVSNDYVCAEYRDNYRSNRNFLKSDVIALDVDNDHSDNPKDWVYPKNISEKFSGVEFAVHYSRNNMKEKDGKAARPKYHVLYPTASIDSAEEYAYIKRRIADYFPVFDLNALDAGRFFFGTLNPKVEIYRGSISITDFMSNIKEVKTPNIIPQGNRNTAMYQIACKLLVKNGESKETYHKFVETSQNCQPPLCDSELQSIWNSATKFYSEKVFNQPDYIPPEKYKSYYSLKPSDYSDVGQAQVLAREYNDCLRYSNATGFIVYNKSYWEENDLSAQKLAQELTEKQSTEATTMITEAKEEMLKNGAQKILDDRGGNERRARELLNEEQIKSLDCYRNALKYQNEVIKSRNSSAISSALKEVKPMLEVKISELDANPFYLNTPSWTYDLSRGLDGRMEHKSEYFITKQTEFDPSNEGIDLWLGALNTFFCGDKELIEYVQQIAGLAAIGKVFLEALIISYGGGRNGKSTFWNAISRVLGSYSGTLSADVLTQNCYRNIKPELAELRGKRLVIASELEEDKILSTSTLKQLCSTDKITAEKKYKDSFSFIPTHTLILYTNFLPKVASSDVGTWRRLIIIPFNARINENRDVKNYGDYLVNKAGGAILSWLIEGAEKIIKNEYKIVVPVAVETACELYRETNDWLSDFLEEYCDVGQGYTELSKTFYSYYRNCCVIKREHVRSTQDFYSALQAAGFSISTDSNRRKIVIGVRLKLHN